MPTSGGLYGGGSSSGGSSSGGLYGGGSRSSGGTSRPRSNTPSPAATTAQKPDVQMVRLAARILRSPNLKTGQAKKIQSYFKGFDAQSIQDIGRQAKLQSGDVERVASLGAARPGTYDVAPVAETPLKVLGIPAQTALGGIAEGPQGAFKGLTGKEYYSGIRAVLQRSGQSAEQAKATEARLPGYVRFPTNLAIETAVDPTTYLTFGASAVDKAAAETFVRQVGEQLGKDAAENAGKKLAEGGIKALDPEARRIAEALPRAVRRHVDRVQGGARFAGQTLPGTKPLTNQTINSGFLRGVQTQTRTFARANALEKARELYPGATNDIRDAFQGLAAGQTRGDIRRAFVAKTTHGLDEAAQQRVMNALDQGGKLSDLVNPAERTAAERLRSVEQLMMGQYTEKQIFRTPEEALKFRQEAVRTENAPKVEAAGQRAEQATAEATRLRDAATQIKEQVGVAQRMGQWGPEVTARFSERAAQAEQAASKAEQAATDLGVKAAKTAAKVETKVGKVKNIENYATHFLTAQAEKQIPGVGGPSGRLSRFTLPRELRDVPARDIVVGVPKNPKPGDQLLPRLLRRSDAVDQSVPSAMELNAKKVFSRRFAAGERDIAQVGFWDQMDKVNERAAKPFMHNEATWDHDIKSAVKEAQVTGKDHVVLNGDKYVIRPRLSAPTEPGGVVGQSQTLIRQEIAHDYDRVAKFVQGGPEVQGFMKGLQHATNLWKAYATTLLPFGIPFTSRNMIGNYINGYWLTGLNPVAGTTEARRLQHVLAEAVSKTGDLSTISNAADRKILEEAINHRVIHAGFYTTDLGHPLEFEKGLKRALFSSRGSPLSQKFVPLAYGQRLNNWVEENARLGVFAQLQKKGYDAESASRIVQKYLFDYADLSHMDERIKQFVPFWTWTRKNLPLQAETLAKTPGKITTQAHVIEGLRGESVPFDPLSQQDYMKQDEGIVAPFKIGGLPTNIRPDIPFTSTYNTLDPLAKALGVLKGNPNAWQELARSSVNASGIGGPLAGILPTLYQLAQGQEFFTQRKFKPGEKRLGLPAEAEFAAEQLAPFGPGLAKIRGLLDSKRRTGKLVGLTGLQATQLTPTTRKNELFRRLAEMTAQQQAWPGLKVPAGRYRTASKKKSPGSLYGK